MNKLKDYRVEAIDFKGNEREIINLRDLSWSLNPTGKAIRYDIAVDRILDVKCIHIAAYEGSLMIAAARMLVTNQLKEVPHYKHFSSTVTQRLEGPYGAITRVVVHPDYRLNGLAIALMNTLEERARKEGVVNLLGYPADWSMKLMNICKYEMVENLGAIIKELVGIDHYLMHKELT